MFLEQHLHKISCMVRICNLVSKVATEKRQHDEQKYCFIHFWSTAPSSPVCFLSIDYGTFIIMVSQTAEVQTYGVYSRDRLQNQSISRQLRLLKTDLGSPEGEGCQIILCLYIFYLSACM